jgi:hypothetical protein
MYYANGPMKFLLSRKLQEDIKIDGKKLEVLSLLPKLKETMPIAR